jgi:hypothetical protein
MNEILIKEEFSHYYTIFNFMNLKKIFIGLGIAFLLFLFYVIYQLATFLIFDNKIKVIQEIKIPNKNYSLKVYYIPSNATTESYIQVRKMENNVEEILKSYERFSYLNNYKIIGDTLSLSISDTSNVSAPIVDVKLKLQ